MVTCGLIDQWTDQWMDQWTDIPTDGWTNGWTMFLFYTDAINASENDDFPKDFAILQSITDQWTNGPTDQQTNGWTYPFTKMQKSI